MTSKRRPLSLPWSTSVVVEYSPVATSAIQTAPAITLSTTPTMAMITATLAWSRPLVRALGAGAEDPAGDRGGKGEEEEQAGAEDEQAEAARAEDQRRRRRLLFWACCGRAATRGASGGRKTGRDGGLRRGRRLGVRVGRQELGLHRGHDGRDLLARRARNRGVVCDDRRRG